MNLNKIKKKIGKKFANIKKPR